MIPLAPQSTPLPQAGAGALPSLLDTREQPDQTEKKLKNRLDVKARSKAEIIMAIKRALETGKICGHSLYEGRADVREILRGWLNRLWTCGREVLIKECPFDGYKTPVIECCNTPVCPHEESRNASRWVRRAKNLMKILSNGKKWHQIRQVLVRASVDIPRKEPKLSSKMSWKLLTIGLRKKDNLFEAIHDAFALRNRLARLLERKFGVVAAYIAIEISPGGLVHLHCLIYSPYIPREQLQHWLQSQDCDVPGCRHVPGDRSCTGSWIVDIRKAYSPHDALKYACSPDPKGNDRDDHAELRVLTHLALYKRHRIETYGLARPCYWKKADTVEEIIEHGFCPHCGSEMITTEKGILFENCYRWKKIPPSRDGPITVTS